MHMASVCPERPMRSIWWTFLIVVCALFSAVGARAQAPEQSLDNDAAGTYFIIAYPDTVGNALDSRYPNTRVSAEFSLWMYSAVKTRVRITGGDPYSTDVVDLEPRVFKIHEIRNNPIISIPNQISRRTFKVEADHPIVMYCYLATIQGLEAWTPIPVEQWGTEYHSASIPGDDVKSIGIAGEVLVPHTLIPAPAEILVIAAFDNTHVSLQIPQGTALMGGPRPDFILNEGEAILVQGRVDTTDDADPQWSDIAGTVIQSDKPIGVLSGNTRARALHDDASMKDNAEKNMLMEWLAPVDQHGKEFVFMPTFDRYRPGAGDVLERKREFVRLYSTQGKRTTGYHLEPGGTTEVRYDIKKNELQEFAFGAPTATYFRSDEAAQAMMHSSAVVALTGYSSCFNNIPCLSYRAVAPYMVELVPREQWTSFAPIYAPLNPGGLAHYVNVVTDTASADKIIWRGISKFPFTRKIPGTDLIWGSVGINPGVTYTLVGTDGAKFTGFAYGTMEGNEEYRPGRTRKKGDDRRMAGGGEKNAPQMLHPCEYEEYNAVSYGYPLAPSRRVLRSADSLKIDTVVDCGALAIDIRALNPKPVGLRSITLEAAQNARLVAVDPAKLSDVIGASRVKVRVEPIDRTKPASATVVIRDRTGKTWRVYFTYEAEYLVVDPAPILDFGEVTLHEEMDREVTITNPLSRPMEVLEIRLVIGTQSFTIVETDPDGPARQPNPKPVVLQPNGSMKVKVRVKPAVENQLYVDTLRVVTACTRTSLPLVAETATPIVYVGDLNFGEMVLPHPPVTLDLKICNQGRGFVTFNRPDNDPAKLLEWDVPDFSVARAEIEALKDVRLGPGECYTVKVTFTPITVGVFRTTARFWSSTRKLRDTSNWTAVVTRPGPGLTGHQWGDRWLTRGAENCTKNETAEYEGIIYVKNTGNSPMRVRSLELIDPDGTAGYFRLATTPRQTTVIPGDEILAHDSMPQKVLFSPKQERIYFTRVRLVTESGEEVFSTLGGTGIESHGMITGAQFDPMIYAGAYPGTSQKKQVTLTALPTRPLYVTDIRIAGPDAADFFVDPAANGVPFSLNPGESKTIEVEFRPQKSGTCNARILFVGDHSLCDDSTNTLAAYTYTRQAEARGVNHGSVLTCAMRDSVVEISNTGTEPLEVRSVLLDDKTGYFSLPGGMGDVLGPLAPGQTKRLPVHFEPTKLGTYSATVSFEVVGADGEPVAVAPVELTGKGEILTVRAHIARTHRGMPGSVIDIPVVLDGALDEARITKLFLGILYNNKMMKLTNNTSAQADIKSMLEGTIVSGWDLNIVESDHAEGEYLAVLTAPKDEYLKGTGNILNMKFLLYLGAVDSSKINFNMLLVGKQCARVIPTPGLARIDSVCGLNLRLIESTGFSYALDQNKPNPFNPTTDITFSLGLDGQTTLGVYDASGKKVATLVDGYMQPGTYQVTWDASTLPSGLYYYRLKSGHWTKSGTMILRK